MAVVRSNLQVSPERPGWPTFTVIVAASVLAYAPLLWLVNSWRDPAYGSHGMWVAATVVALFVYSLSSPRLTPRCSHDSRYLTWLMCTALVRLIGQVAGINMFAALTLVIDIFVVAMMSGVKQRVRPVSPLWLAMLFFMSLPLGRVVQRLVGFPMQLISADGACALLSSFTDDVTCDGVYLTLSGHSIVVDLACAGSTVLQVNLFVFAVVAAVRFMHPRQLIVGLLIFVAAAYAANVVRIVALAVGIAYPNIFFNVDVNAAPWHEGIGLIAIVLGLSPALAWAARLPALSNLGGTRQRAYSFASANTTIVSRSAACAMLSIAIVIVSLPARPLDVAIAMPPPRLPNWLNDHPREPLPLSDVESSYFARYGGGAARARYGADILLVVSTSSPLRHLHAPDECLRGSGHEVRYVGRSLDRYPTALYRSTDSSGQTWRIAVSFVSDAGEVATSVGEVAWKWFQSPQRSWTMIERISPWVRDVEARRFGDSVFSAMDVQIANTVDDKQI